MKKHLLKRALLGALIVIAFAVPAMAGPGPMQTYTPVTTMAEAKSIEPGAHIAVVCGKCGRMTTMVADKDRSFLSSYTCRACKTTFKVRQDPHGGTHGSYVAEDDSGHRASLYEAK